MTKHAVHVTAVGDHDVRGHLYPVRGRSLDRGVEGGKLALGELRGRAARPLYGGEFFGRGSEDGQVDAVEAGGRGGGQHCGAGFAVRGESHGETRTAGNGDEAGQVRVKGGFSDGEVDF